MTVFERGEQIFPIQRLILFQQNVLADEAENYPVAVDFQIDYFILRVVAEKVKTDIRMRVRAGKKQTLFLRRDFVKLLQIFRRTLKIIGNR